MNIVELDTMRPHVNELQRCHECGAEQISTHPEKAKREWWECVKCGEMACKAVEIPK
jgi:uncharacterized protein with PIN domain